MELEVRGDRRPYPMLKAIEAMKRLNGDGVIQVVTGHPPALETIPPQAQRLGFSTAIEETALTEWVIALWREGQEKAS